MSELTETVFVENDNSDIVTVSNCSVESFERIQYTERTRTSKDADTGAPIASSSRKSVRFSVASTPAARSSIDLRATKSSLNLPARPVGPCPSRSSAVDGPSTGDRRPSEIASMGGESLNSRGDATRCGRQKSAAATERPRVNGADAGDDSDVTVTASVSTATVSTAYGFDDTAAEETGSEWSADNRYQSDDSRAHDFDSVSSSVGRRTANHVPVHEEFPRPITPMSAMEWYARPAAERLAAEAAALLLEEKKRAVLRPANAVPWSWANPAGSRGAKAVPKRTVRAPPKKPEWNSEPYVDTRKSRPWNVPSPAAETYTAAAAAACRAAAVPKKVTRAPAVPKKPEWNSQPAVDTRKSRPWNVPSARDDATPQRRPQHSVAQQQQRNVIGTYGGGGRAVQQQQQQQQPRVPVAVNHVASAAINRKVKQREENRVNKILANKILNAKSTLPPRY